MSQSAKSSIEATSLANPFTFSPTSIPNSLGVPSTGAVPLETGSSSRNAAVAAVIVLLIAIFFALYQFVADDSPSLESFKSLFSWGLSGNQEREAPAPKPSVPPVTPVVKPPAVQVKPVEGNPYWILPNVNLAEDPRPATKGSAWSMAEEAAVREGLAHPFVYQHYKAVQDIRSRRWLGSEVELKKALKARKFWTRMFAAVGLAEFGYTVRLLDLDQALKNERSELISGFFQRFVEKPDAGQTYLFRQVIRLVDARSRLILLEGIAVRKDPLSGLYLFAGTKDKNPKVQALSARLFARQKAGDLDIKRYEQVVKGELGGNAFLAQIGAVRPERTAADRNAAPQEGLTKMVTDADIDQEQDQEINAMMEDLGDVEVYEFSGDSDESSGSRSSP